MDLEIPVFLLLLLAVYVEREGLSSVQTSTNPQIKFCDYMFYNSRILIYFNFSDYLPSRKLIKSSILCSKILWSSK